MYKSRKQRKDKKTKKSSFPIKYADNADSDKPAFN